jgi:hypothetical protein
MLNCANVDSKARLVNFVLDSPAYAIDMDMRAFQQKPIFSWLTGVGKKPVYLDIYVREGGPTGNPVGLDRTGFGPFVSCEDGFNGDKNNIIFNKAVPGRAYCFALRARTEAGTQGCVSERESNWSCATVPPPTTATAAALPPPKPIKPLGKRATWEYGSSITLDAFSPLGFSVRHRNFLGELTKIDRGNQVDREDATFILRPALNGNADAVSFESVNYPGLFLRHQDFRLKLSKNDNSPLFKDDASFFKRAALAGGAATASFEASKYPGFYIRHRDFHLWLEKNDPPSDIFKKDATFIIEPGLVAAGGPTPGSTSSQTAKVIADVDVYAKPGGNGDPVGILRAGESVALLSACADNWCNVAGEAVPGGKGWVYDGPDYDSLQY